MAELSKITLPDGTTVDLKDAKKTGIYPVVGTQTASTGSWTGAIDVSALYAGLTIAYQLPYAGSGNATLNLTISGGGTTGAKNCYFNASRLTTQYPAGSTIIMTYWPAGSISVAGTATTDDRWIASGDYDTNSDTWRNLTVNSGAWKSTSTTSGAANFADGTNITLTTNSAALTISSNRYGACSTAAATAAKTVTIAGTFALEAGAMAQVYFSNRNTADSPTLNINSTGAKNIFVGGKQITTGANKGVLGNMCFFVYDGTQYHLVNADSVYILYNHNTADYPITFAASGTDGTTDTEYLRKCDEVTIDPSAGNIKTVQINGVTVGNSPKFTDTTYTAGAGLSLSSTTFNHSNSVTAGTAGTSSATSGSTLAVPYVTYDAQGHVTASGTHTHTVSGFLTSHQTIYADGITGANNSNNTGKLINRYAACSTAAATAAKTASITSGTFTLEAGATVAVKFTNANTAGTPTLNINSTGAKNIFNNGAQITTGDNKALLKGLCTFIYDGTQWHLIGNYIDTDTNTNTWRNVQVNGTEILGTGTGTGALNLKAGTNVSVTNSSGTVTIAATDTNTTYTFANGTNGFTVTPSGGSAQTVTVTPSISNATTSAAGLMSATDKTNLDTKRVVVNTTTGPNISGLTNQDANAITGTAVVHVKTNKPSTVTTDGALFQMGYSEDYKTQLLLDNYTNRAYVRNKHAGTWNDWSEIYTTTQAPPDTKNTAGSTNSTSKLFLVGAASQAANPQTYSNSNVYATNGVMNATSYDVAATAHISYDSTEKAILFTFS